MSRNQAFVGVLGAALFVASGPALGALPHGGIARPAARVERPSEATSAAVDELLEVSALRAHLDAIAGGIRAQLQTGGLGARDRALVERIAARHFDAEMLYARLRVEVGRNVETGRLDAALAWYRSPLGRRITRHEVAAIAGGRAGAPVPSEARIELVQRLDERGGASETALDVAMALARSLARAAEPLRPAHLRLTPDQLEDRLARARTEALAPIRITCLGNMLFAYRELSDDELAEYVRFVESPAGQWYAATLNQALVDAASVAAELAAVELLTLVPHLTGDRR
jgi:hypothetical protein